MDPFHKYHLPSAPNGLTIGFGTSPPQHCLKFEHLLLEALDAHLRFWVERLLGCPNEGWNDH
jgi:hypothetical protein